MIRFFLFFIVLFFATPVFAQQYPSIYDPIDTSKIKFGPPHLIQIVTHDAERVMFSMSFDQIHWKDFVVYQDDAILINLEKHETALLRLCSTSAEDCLRYDIEHKKKYEIFYNYEQEEWELKPIPGN